MEVVSKRLNEGLQLSGVMLCMYDSTTRLAAEVSSDVESFFNGGPSAKQVLSNAKFFETKIRRNIRLAEAPSFGQSIFQYAPDSNGAADYRALADEVMAQAATQLARAA